MDVPAELASAACEAAAYAQRPELALVALMTMMSAFPGRPSPAIAGSIVAHLRDVAADERLPPVLQSCAIELLGVWCRYEMLARTDVKSAN